MNSSHLGTFDKYTANKISLKTQSNNGVIAMVLLAFA